MNPTLLLRLSALAALATLTPAGAQTTRVAAAQPVAADGRSNGIAAVVNGRPILHSDVEEVIKVQGMLLRSSIGDKSELDKELSELRSKALDTQIEQELILKEFEPYAANFNSKIDAYAEERIKTFYIKEMFKGDRVKFNQDLAASGMSYKKLFQRERNKVIVGMMQGQNVKDVGYVTSDEKAAYLKANEADFRDGDQLKLWSISIPLQGEELGSTPKSQMALAKEIRTKLLRGDDFATMARTYSQDSKSSSGGDWGVITKKDLTRRMAELVFALPAKKVSEVIEFEGSYYIFYVEAKIPGKMKPKEEVEAELEKRVLMEKRKKAYEEWIVQLKRKATISIK